MKKIVVLAFFLLALLFCACASAEPEWVFPENDENVRFFVLTASSDDKNMLIYTMRGRYPYAETDLYLLNPATGVCTRLDFTKYADDEAAIAVIKERYANDGQYRDKNMDELLPLLFDRENTSDPYDYLLSASHRSQATLMDLRDDYAMIMLPDYCCVIVNLKTGEAYIPKDDTRALGADGTYITWDNTMVYHFGPGDELIRTYLPELPEGTSVSLARINDDGSLAICAMSIENMTFNYTFILTDSKGNAEKVYPLGSSRNTLSNILASPDGKTYVVFNPGTSMFYPAHIIDAESDAVNMLKMDSAILLDRYFYAAVQTAYDSEAEYETKIAPLRFNQENELIALAVSGDSDLIKINLDTNEATVLLTGIQWRELGNQKSPDLFNHSQTLLVSVQSHNGSGILSVYPGGAIRHEP